MYFLNARALPIGGGVGPLKVLDDTNAVHPVSDLVSAVHGHDVLLVTHGFNVNHMDGLQKLSDWCQADEPRQYSLRGYLMAGRRAMDSCG